MRTSIITRPQQRRSPASHSRISTSETLCRNAHPRSPNQNARHVPSQTSHRTITPGPSTRRPKPPTQKHRDICVSSNRQTTRPTIDLATAVHLLLRLHLASPHLCLTHLLRRSAIHYRIPLLRPRAPCRPDTTRTAHRMARRR